MSDYVTKAECCLEKARTLGKRCGEFLVALKMPGIVKELGGGELPAGDACATFKIRYHSLKAVGVDTRELEEVVDALGSLADDEPVLLWHFEVQAKYFTLFVRGSDHHLLGCWSVDRSV